MRLVRASIGYPVTVIVAVLLVLLFGGIALLRLPLQMVPTVDRPVITVQTPYPGAAPLEVEQQVTDKIEEQLNFVEGLLEITSVSREGMSEITLKFAWGVDKDIARLDVSEKLGTVRGLPDDVEESIIQATSSDEETPISWITIDTDRPINEIRPEAEDVIKVRLERVEGVAATLFFGGEDREVHVILDDRALAARGLGVEDVRTALLLENRNVRGGTLDEGKRRWVVRTVGEFTDLEGLRSVVVSRGEGRPVYLRDVAEVRFAYAKRQFALRQQGKPSIGFGVLRRTGANVVAVMERVRAEVEQLNRVYRDQGIQLELVYDETDYIYEARGLVTSNLLLGGALAGLVLLLFLREGRSTIIIAFSMPLSLVATFTVLYALGRSLNIVTLAGLAFAIGMVVDNAIVVLENIYRHREMGKPRWQAAYDGTVEVWGAVLASTLTTLAVFVPILFVQEEAGQLFRDLALAIATAVAFSLLVAMTVIPMLSARLLSESDGDAQSRRGWLARFGPLTAIASLGAGFTRSITAFNAWLLSALWRRLSLAVIVTVVSIVLAIALVPPVDYLPTGNRNMVMWFVQTQPGLNVDRASAILQEFEGRILPQPEVAHFFGVGGPSFFFMGALVKDEYSDLETMKGLVGRFGGMSQGIPGVRFAIATQPSIFASRGGGFVGGTNLDVVVRGPDLGTLEQAAGMMEGMIWQAKMQGALRGGINIVLSSYEPGNPELQVLVDRERATVRGLRARDVGSVVESLVEGVKTGVFREKGKELDIVVKGGGLSVERSQDIANVYLRGPDGGPVPLGDVADVVMAAGPTKVEHTDLDRSIKLTVNLAREVPLGEAMDYVEKNVIERVRPTLPRDGGYSIDLRGQAEDLARTFDALKGSFLLALIITFLLMAALFESFANPVVILFSVPLAATGGVIGLALSHAIEPTVKLDTITMLGFILLVGVVVNNAILIVHQTLNNLRTGMRFADGLVESVRTRIRPIFMSTTTSVLGMLPLVMAGGKGSELYRGLGSVVVGGLALSTVFTLFLVPAVFALFVDLRRVFSRRLGWKSLEDSLADDRATAQALARHERLQTTGEEE